MDKADLQLFGLSITPAIQAHKIPTIIYHPLNEDEIQKLRHTCHATVMDLDSLLIISPLHPAL